MPRKTHLPGFAGAISIPELKTPDGHCRRRHGGRKPVQKGSEKAAAYIEAHFKNLGLAYIRPHLVGFSRFIPCTRTRSSHPA